jgi:hypothetical protein
MKSICITKKRRRLMQVEWKWCDKLNRDNLKHNFIWFTTFRRRHHPFLIVYYVPFCGDYIQMSIFPKTLKWESQNWDFCCPKTFNVYIFFQIKFVLRKRRQNFIATKKSFSMVYNTLQSNLI